MFLYVLHAKNGFYILKFLLKKENVKQNTVHKVWNIYCHFRNEVSLFLD